MSQIASITNELSPLTPWLAGNEAAAPVLRERQLLRALVDALPDHIYVKDRECRFILTNTAVSRLVGVESPDQMIGKMDFDFFPVLSATQFYQEEQALLHSGQSLINREARVVDAEGREQWLLTTKVPLRGADGDVTGIVGINRDITARKQSEMQLRQLNEDLARSQRELVEVYAQLHASHRELKSTQMKLFQAEKMESVGRLAAGVAHEVKNPLATILMGVEYLGDGLPPGDENVPVVVAGIREAALRADAIIRGLLDFSAPNRLELTPANVNHVIDKSLQLLRYEVRRRCVAIRREFAEGLPLVPLDQLKIEQVIVNLCLNAVQAMAEGGEVSITTRAREDQDARVVVEIADTGPGIPEANLPQIFEPFFTTKAASMGSGLGLAVAKTIVELHHGTITLANRPNGGVLAQLTFPTNPKVDHA